MLVVDADADARRAITAVLRRMGLDPVSAPDLETAFDVAMTHSVALMLLDDRLGGSNANELLNRFRHDPQTRGLRVVILSDNPDSRESAELLDAGAVDIVAKPIDTEELAARVRAQLLGRGAWLDLVASLRRRASVLDALAHIDTSQSAGAAAAECCRGLVAQHAVRSAGIILFRGTRVAVPLAVNGAFESILHPGTPLPAAAAEALGERARRGPWVERASVTSESTLRDLGDDSLGMLAYAPLTCGRLSGLLVIEADGEHRDNGDPADGLLSAAIDYAALATAVLAPVLECPGEREAARTRLRERLTTNAFTPNFQPIVDLASGRAAGHEALTRWHDGTRPDIPFDEARELGIGVELEQVTAAAALDAAKHLDPSVFLALNVSPALLRGGHVHRLLRTTQRLIVLEISARETITDARALRACAETLYPLVRIALDDAGPDHRSVRRMIELQPAFVKLDLRWVRGIEADRARQVLVAGLVRYAHEAGAELIAEGIETERARRVLTDLGVHFGQGSLIGRPAPVAASPRKSRQRVTR